MATKGSNKSAATIVYRTVRQGGEKVRKPFHIVENRFVPSSEDNINKAESALSDGIDYDYYVNMYKSTSNQTFRELHRTNPAQF